MSTSESTVTQESFKLGAFALDREIGRGGMAAVWSAENVLFGGEAAVKVMEGSIARGERYRRIFQDEVRSHARLEHPRIVQLLDYGEISEDDVPPPGARVGDPYLVMEEASGTLRDRFAMLSWDTVLPTLLQVLDALAYAHARDVVHRDLKPENVLVFGDGIERVKLSDFGIAHSVKLDETADRSSLSTMVGTPHYMAPEQFRGHWYEFGPWTDLYALGCVAYELTTGAAPFDSKGVFELAMMHSDVPMPRPEFRFEVPPGFERWLARLLEKEARDRFRSAADTATTLLRFSRGFQPGQSSLSAVGSGAEFESDDAVANEPTELLDFVAAAMTTLHDSFEELGTAETLLPDDQVIAAVGATEQERVVEPCEITAAPMPHRWRTPGVSVARPGGLGLFAFREPPLTGFQETRDRLWAQLAEVTTKGGAKSVMLRGESAAPIEDLGRWLAVRAREVGVANSFEIAHSRAGGPREGLVGMLEDYFGTWALPDDAIRGRVGDVVSQLSLDAAELYEESLSAEILRARGVSESVDVVSRAQIARMTGRLLAARAAERPLVLLVENAQRNTLTAGFVREMREIAESAPVLLVVTERTDEDPAPGANAELEAIATGESNSVVEARRYTAEEQADIIRDLLPIDPQAVEQICRVAPGDLIATRLLISELLETEEVRPAQGERFTVEPHAIPPDLDSLLNARLERTLPREGVQQLFEIAGLLGEAPDRVELREAAEIAGVSADVDDLVGALLDSGLAEGRRHRWSLAHPGLVRLAERRAESSGRAEELHRACGEAIVKRASPDLPEPWVRAARHFVRSGRPRSALRPLETAAALLRGSSERQQPLLKWREEIISVLQLPEDAPEVIDQRLLVSPMLWSAGRGEDALRQAKAAAASAQATGYLRGLSGAHRQLARLMQSAGSTEDATAHFETAVEVAERGGSPLDQAAAEFGLGSLRYRVGEIDAAEANYRRAFELYGDAGSPRRQAVTRSYLSAALISRGDFAAAEVEAEAAMAIAMKTGQLELVASIGEDMGELARFRGDLEAARRHYAESRHLLTLLGADTTFSDLNLALVSVAEGHVAEATELLTLVKEQFRARGHSEMDAIISAVASALAVQRGDRHAAMTELNRSIAALGDAGDRDVAWVFSTIGRRAVGVELQEQFLEVAAEQFERLGDTERADELRAQLDQLRGRQ